MKFGFFLRILITGVIVLSSLTIVSLIPIVTQSSIGLLSGGVATFPQATAFVPKQAPAMVSLLANPEKLYGIRQASLPLSRRQRDRQEWSRWIIDNTGKIGLDYRQLKPWLGDEITLAVTAVDYDRNSDNGLQPGYLFALKARNIRLAQEYLDNVTTPNISIERYKGAEIIAVTNPPKPKSEIRATALVGNFVLFANRPQIIREAINQAQAISLNIEQSENYRQAIANITQPRIAIAYLDVPQTQAWLNSSEAEQTNGHLSAFLSIDRRRLDVQTALSEADGAENQVYKSLLDRTELGKIIALLPLEDRSYIDLKDRTPNTVAKLAIKELFPHLEAIAIENEGDRDNVDRTKILFKLDAR